MKKIIFSLDKIKLIYDFVMNSRKRKWGKSPLELDYTIIQDDLKSFQPSPINGMKWSKEEKLLFEKLSHVEKKKYLINKMGFKCGVLFPYLSHEKLYKYPEIRQGDETSKEFYEKGLKALSDLKIEFCKLEEKKQKEILNYFRFASERDVLKASKELADLLCERNFQYEREESISELKEASILYKLLARAGSPDGYYGYYKLYRYVSDNRRYYNKALTSEILNVNRMQALSYLNLAFESGHKEALEDLAYDFEHVYKGYQLSLDIMMTIGYLYQDRKAFEKAMNYANYYVNVNVYEMFYIACMRMSIMLGGSLNELISCYNLNISVHANPSRGKQLKEYAKNRQLIDGLDPYFDEYFPPDLVLDFGTEFYGDMYGGTEKYPGVYKWIEDGKMKDPRDKDSTLATVKDFYQKLWQIIIWKLNYRVNYSKEIIDEYYTTDSYTMYLLYRQYSSGFTSARPYVFPKEVLDMPIDFNNVPAEDFFK